MHLADNFPAIHNIAEQCLDRLNNVFFSGASGYDNESKTFYTFKPYPQNLKSTQIEDWAKLQCKVLAPFVNSDYYCYLHSKGLCFWSSMTPLKGVPETAMQRALPDGTHVCRGKTFTYRQTWKNGVMHNCEILHSSSSNSSSSNSPPSNSSVTSGTSTNKTDANTLVDHGAQDVISLDIASSAWARKRQIDQWLAAPVTWAAVVLVLALVFFISLGSGYIAMQSQLNSLESEQAKIQLQLGDKLEKQTQLQVANSLVEGLNQWQTQSGFMPQTLAQVINVVTEQVAWDANLIQWQERTLLVELLARDLDIAKMVVDLEDSGNFSQVSVRPSQRQNTWQIEVTVNE